jgi:molybdenum cofactor cytidylyltransferase
MPIHLEPITRKNFHECLRLHTGAGQEHFVASNAVSIVQAYVEPAFIPRAIYHDGQMVGFVMYGRDPESRIDWIVRLMVDARYQGRGYGRAGLLAALDALKRSPDPVAIRVSYRPEDLAAERLYVGVGFRPIDRLADGEVVAELRDWPPAADAPPVAGLILAAGAAARMGQPKQLLDWGGQPLVRQAAETALAARLSPLLVVVGSARVEVEAALAGLPLQTVPNPDYLAGQSTSLRVGIAALPPEAAAVVVLLADQPFVTAALVERLVAAWRASAAPIVAPVYAGQRGNPVLFARAVFPELLAIQGDQGARAVLAADPSRVLAVPFDDARPLADIDTPEEYERLLSQKNDKMTR